MVVFGEGEVTESTTIRHLHKKLQVFPKIVKVDWLIECMAKGKVFDVEEPENECLKADISKLNLTNTNSSNKNQKAM